MEAILRFINKEMGFKVIIFSLIMLSSNFITTEVKTNKPLIELPSTLFIS